MHFALTCWRVHVEPTRRLRESRSPILSVLRINYRFSTQGLGVFDEQHGDLSPSDLFFLHNNYEGYQWLVLIVVLKCVNQNNYFDRIVHPERKVASRVNGNSSTVT